MLKNKFKLPKTFLTIILLIAFCLPLTATVRYVSHSGSNTPPYTSWETAADSIMFAINISDFGDTIYVANGVYIEEVTMIRGLALIGSGIDSCIIDTRTLEIIFAVTVRDSCIFKNFKVIVSNYNTQTQQWDGIGVYAYDLGSPGYQSVIELNDIQNASYGIASSTSNTLMRKNNIKNCETGIRLSSGDQEIINQVIDNYIVSRGVSIYLSFGGTPYIANNICIGERGFWGSYSGLNEIYNNLFITRSGTAIGLSDNTLFINNIITGFSNEAILVGGDNQVVKNNVIENAEVGIKSNTPGNPVIQYNNFWNLGVVNQNTSFPDSTNIFRDPMFMDDTSDFHLQMFSPLIDAGDPNILDVDGSRSDIGIYGGPLGERYSYQDLAPKPPSNLTAVYDSGFVLLRWNRNTEADFYRYRVYRDTVPNFIYDTTKIIAVVADTFYYDDLPEKYLATDYYYKLTAMDSTGHQSATSEEVNVTVTGVPEGPPIVVEEYKLLQNYPNPFNPSTIIPYRLIEPGYVKLYVYDIKGELVRILVNQYQTSGYYEVEFRPNSSERGKGNLGSGWATGYNDDIASGIYIYQIMVKSDRNIPVFTDMNKMILLK